MTRSKIIEAAAKDDTDVMRILSRIAPEAEGTVNVIRHG
jgi:hypothetical protein